MMARFPLLKMLIPAISLTPTSKLSVNVIIIADEGEGTQKSPTIQQLAALDPQWAADSYLRHSPICVLSLI